MENFKDMLNRHQWELKELQKGCNHLALTNWLPVGNNPHVKVEVEEGKAKFPAGKQN